MAASFDITTVPFTTPSQRWGDVSEVEQPAVVMVPFTTPAQRWGDVSEVPQPTVEAVPFTTPSQRWGDLLEVPLGDQAIEDYADPSSLPFVIEAELDPAPGETDVSQAAPILIPCGDRLAASEDHAAPLLDPFLGGSSSAEPLGLDPLEKVIRVQIGGGAPVTVLAGGVVTPGWSVGATLTDQAGSHRGVAGVGRNYLVTPPSLWPALTTIAVTVELVDYGKKVTIYSYSWETEPDFLRLDSITEAVSKQGGDDLVCLGLFPIGVPMAVTLGGVSCYGGPNYGYTCWSKNGSELRCAAPPLPLGSYTFSVTASGVTRSIGPVLVVERYWRTKEFSLHECFPAWACVGPRRLEES